MLQTDQILDTVRMLQTQHLDVRTVTMGIDINGCAGPNINTVCRNIRKRITTRAAGGEYRSRRRVHGTG